MADEAVIVDKIGTIFLGGPPLVKVWLQEERWWTFSVDLNLTSRVFFRCSGFLPHQKLNSCHYLEGHKFISHRIDYYVLPSLNKVSVYLSAKLTISKRLNEYLWRLECMNESGSRGLGDRFDPT